MNWQPHDYQRRAVAHVLAHPRCCLFLGCGLGKTVVTLTAAATLLSTCEARRVLVVAPKMVAQSTWRDEAAKWDHLRHLRFAHILGTPAQRARAMEAEADVWVTSRDLFVKVVESCGFRLPWDMVVLDELTSFKTPSSLRVKAMRRCSGITRVVGLTGTPAPNGLLDLWAQMACVDQGAALGTSYTRYRSTYFDCVEHNHIVVKAFPKRGAEEAIRARLAPVCLSMEAADYLALPPLVEVDSWVEAPHMERYREFEREQVLALDGEDVTAATAAALMNKLGQWANGCVYGEGRTEHEVHDAKLLRLAEIVEAAQSPVVCYYQYRSDVARARRALRGLRVAEYDGAASLEAWNAGAYDVLLAHPASVGYGLNMQRGGHVCAWLGTGWNLELCQQAVARLHRQGQREPVVSYRIACRGTVDERCLAALRGKEGTQAALLSALKEIRGRHASQEAAESQNAWQG